MLVSQRTGLLQRSSVSRNRCALARATVSTTLRRPVSVDLEDLGKNKTLPLNTHGVGKAGKQPPFIGKVVSIERLGGRDKERDVSHIVIDTGGVEFVEGQSFGVQPPGTKLNSRGVEVPQHVRLYSIASSRYGDSGDGQTCTLCVVRVIYTDPKTGQEVRGLCSNYLCDVKAGDELVMTGPAGTALLLADDPWSKRIVCVSTGTGIAPFRSSWRRIFFDGIPGRPDQPFSDRAMFWLLSGFANQDSILYGDELQAALAANPKHMRLDIALSLEQQNQYGGPEYVQDRIHEHADEFLDLMQSDDAIFYFCGLKRMYSSVLEMLETMGRENRGIDVPALITKLKKTHRWHVETA
eukprot:GHUV01003808.1.p1 GENE.GHUV01003808.1~~GHUV01003808.1.p1  ORF type:complete len:352 (+),score=82.06 GHUV01003808.1:1450-2505(+)